MNRGSFFLPNLRFGFEGFVLAFGSVVAAAMQRRPPDDRNLSRTISAKILLVTVKKLCYYIRNERATNSERLAPKDDYQKR